MKKRYIFYVIIEALIIAVSVYLFAYINRAHLSVEIASIDYDLTLNEDVYFGDESITLHKGTVISPSFINSNNAVCFYVDDYPHRLFLDAKYFEENEKLSKSFELHLVETNKHLKEITQKNILISICAFVVYLLIASIITWLFREKAFTLVFHRILSALLLAGALFILINSF